MYLYQINLRCLKCVLDVHMYITMTTTCDYASSEYDDSNLEHIMHNARIMILLNTDVMIVYDVFCFKFSKWIFNKNMCEVS